MPYQYQICITMVRDEEDTPEDVVNLCQKLYNQTENEWDANGEMPKGGYGMILKRVEGDWADWRKDAVDVEWEPEIDW